jgi:hypothetical protein
MITPKKEFHDTLRILNQYHNDLAGQMADEIIEHAEGRPSVPDLRVNMDMKPTREPASTNEDWRISSFTSAATTVRWVFKYAQRDLAGRDAAV